VFWGGARFGTASSGRSLFRRRRSKSTRRPQKGKKKPRLGQEAAFGGGGWLSSASLPPLPQKGTRLHWLHHRMGLFSMPAVAAALIAAFRWGHSDPAV
jgi:hypothetical protein